MTSEKNKGGDSTPFEAKSFFGGAREQENHHQESVVGQMVERDISGMTPAELEAFPLDEGICDEIARAIAPCLPEEFLAAYVKRVGAITAGIAIFGAQFMRRGLRDADDGSVSTA